MTPPRPDLTLQRADHRQVVRTPRASDGIGNALRQIYGGQPTLPREMTMLLDRLSRD